MEGQESLRFNYKYLYLSFEDEWMIWFDFASSFKLNVAPIRQYVI